MRDQDDGPHIVIEKDGGGNLGSFLLGALLGAGVALLLAPRSGAETQQRLKEQAKKLKGAAETHVLEAQRTIEERLDVAKEGVQSKIGLIRDAVEQGREATREARGDLEMKLERSKSAYRAGVGAAKEETDPAEEGQEESAAE